MKRFHVHVGVENLGRSIGFYSILFVAPPKVAKPDYAKWMLDDARVNFAISSGDHAAKGIRHLGIQAKNEAKPNDVYSRLDAANRPVLDEGATTCCYAKSRKSWVSDPDGVVSEAFHTNGDATGYSTGASLGALVQPAPVRVAPACGCPA